MQVMIVVTHLLGTGHLSRAITLGRAFSDAGHTVTLVSGGRPVPHLDRGTAALVQLPPVASDGTDFTTLLDAQGHSVTDMYMKARQTALIDAFDSVQPDVLITELFPFGRRVLRQEFQSLLQRANGRCAILSSVRDILAPPSKPQKVRFADALIDTFYDGVLVHSDSDVINLSQSWPVSVSLADKVHYTGFVAPAPVPIDGPRQGPVLVSAGGGNVGDAVFNAAIEAAQAMPEMDWHMVVGGDPERRASLADQAPDTVVVDGLRSDFRALMAQARASVSMCGYNTALDVLQTGVPAVLVPFDDGGEQEQTLRAEALSRLPAITCIKQCALTGTALATALANVMVETRTPAGAGMNGAAEAVRIAERIVKKRHVTD